MASNPPSPPSNLRSSLRSPPALEGPKESIVSRLLIAPLTFISFLISLALIDTRNHSIRSHQHMQPSAPPTTFLGRTKGFFHSIIYKPVATKSPYAYVRSPEGSKDPSKDGDEPWHWHTKQRKMMKAEVSDAFKMRTRVLVVLGVVMVGVVVGSYVTVGWVFLVVRGWMEG